jgi:hypothetical protein
MHEGIKRHQSRIVKLSKKNVNPNWTSDDDSGREDNSFETKEQEIHTLHHINTTKENFINPFTEVKLENISNSLRYKNEHFGGE